MQTSAAFDRFSQLLAERGVRAALAFVLELSEFRYLGIFRFDGGRALASVHIDREHPALAEMRDAPDYLACCCLVRNGRGMLITANALVDHRLTSHTTRPTVRAHWGVPILAPDGELIATLCHYDVVPRDTSRLDTPLLEQIAGALQRGRLVPPFPAGDAVAVAA